MSENVKTIEKNSTSELIEMHKNITQFLSFLEKEEKNIKEK